MARPIKLDVTDDGLRDILKYELTKVSGTLEYRINHLLEALRGRALLLKDWERRKKIMKKRGESRDKKTAQA